MQQRAISRETRQLGLLPKIGRHSKKRKSTLQQYGGTTRKSTTTFRNLGLSFLENITPVSYTKAYVNSGRDYEFLKDRIAHINLIKLLYQYLQKHPQFKDNQNWNTITEEREVLIWLIEEMNTLIGQEYSWQLVQPYQETDYNLVTTESIYLDNGGYYTISLCFLPQLRVENELLHDILMDLFAQIRRITQVSLWDEQHGEWSLDWMIERDDFETEEEKRAWELDISNYTEGTANYYSISLNNNQSTLKTLAKKLSKFKPKTKLEQQLYDWIEDGISIIKSKTGIHQFCYYPRLNEYEDDDILRPDEYMFLSWDQNDNFFSEYMATLEVRANEYGESPFINWEVTKPSDNTFKKPQSTTFPKEITQFFKTGDDLSLELKTALV